MDTIIEFLVKGMSPVLSPTLGTPWTSLTSGDPKKRPRPQEGLVYAVEFSHRSGRDLINVAKKRTNVIPVIEDARHPHKYRMLIGETPFLGDPKGSFGVSGGFGRGFGGIW